jgi:uncharacterized protein YhfF
MQRFVHRQLRYWRNMHRRIMMSPYLENESRCWRPDEVVVSEDSEREQEK